MADYYDHGTGTMCDNNNHALIGDSCDCGRYRRPAPPPSAKTQDLNLAAIARACRAFLEVWADTHAESSQFGPATSQLMDALPTQEGRGK